MDAVTNLYQILPFPLHCLLIVRGNLHRTLVLKQVFYTFMQRSYNIALPHKKIPDKLCMLAKRMAAPAMPCSEEFHPEAAIVNYFGLGMP